MCYKFYFYMPTVQNNLLFHLVKVIKNYLNFYRRRFIYFCKVEFIQPSNWLYSVPNLFVIQHLVTLYLGEFDVRVVSEIE